MKSWTKLHRRRDLHHTSGNVGGSVKSQVGIVEQILALEVDWDFTALVGNREAVESISLDGVK
jgi:hypothetical protein